MRRKTAIEAGLIAAVMVVSPLGWGQSPKSGGRTYEVQMVPAQATLEMSLNAKRLKPGEAIKAKLEADVRLSNAAMLKRNTVLMGEVNTVEASHNHGASEVTVTFDKAELGHGKELSVAVTVMAVSAPKAVQPTILVAALPPALQGGKTGGVPGVTLESSASQATSATFRSQDKNVMVPSGTEMQLAIAHLPKHIPGQ